MYIYTYIYTQKSDLSGTSDGKYIYIYVCVYIYMIIHPLPNTEVFWNLGLL